MGDPRPKVSGIPHTKRLPILAVEDHRTRPNSTQHNYNSTQHNSKILAPAHVNSPTKKYSPQNLFPRSEEQQVQYLKPSSGDLPT